MTIENKDIQDYWIEWQKYYIDLLTSWLNSSDVWFIEQEARFQLWSEQDWRKLLNKLEV